MRKKDKNTLLITTLICACTVIIYGIFCHFYLAERILTQDFYVGLFLLAIIIFNIILNIGLNFTVCKKRGAKFLVRLGKCIMPFTSLFFVIISIHSRIFPDSLFTDSAVYVFVGLVFIVSGNYFPKNQMNPYIGLKFPWLLHDEKSWDKTHRLAGYTWILAGFLCIFQLFISPLKIVIIPLVIILVGILPLVYSLMLVYMKRR